MTDDDDHVSPSSLRNCLSEVTRSGRLPALCVALGCLAMVYGFLWAGEYKVDTAVINGARLGDPAQIASSAGVLDQSIVRIDPDDVARRVAGVPWVAAASVRLKLPDTVVIDLTERKPAVVWESGEQRVLVDSGGQVLLSGDAADLPHVQTSDTLPAVGDQLDALDVAAAQAISEALGSSIATLSVSDAEGFKATLADTRVIVFGDAGQMPAKLAALDAFAARSDVEWSLLDLSEPNRPYYR